MNRPSNIALCFALLLNLTYLASSVIYYHQIGDTVFGTPPQVLWMPFIAGFYAAHVIFPETFQSYRHAVSGAMIYSTISVFGGALFWLAYALIVSGISVAVISPFSMLAIFMMAIDGIRNLIVMIPLMLLLVWLKNWLNS